MLPSLPPLWRPWLEPEQSKPYFRALEAFLSEEEKRGAEVLPAAADRYAALAATPPEGVRVVIVGQDPYPTPGHAHGLAFSVRPDVRPLPGSLRNIYLELNADLGLPKASHGCLQAWAERGVLLLNTVLTVRAGEAASHQKRGWESFTDTIIARLNARPGRIVFLLWGRHAHRKAEQITSPWHTVIQTAHPSPLSARLFLGCRCFSKVNAALVEAGLSPIDWSVPALTRDQLALEL